MLANAVWIKTKERIVNKKNDFEEASIFFFLRIDDRKERNRQ